MRIRNIRLILGLLFAWLLLPSASAATFTPAAGTVISSTSVTVEWQSDERGQWVRAFDVGGNRIYDSLRQGSSAGSVTFSIPADLTGLSIVFYEFVADQGAWVPEERSYSVAIGDMGDNGDNGDGSDSVTLAGLNCSPDQIAVSLGGGEWDCSDPVTTDAEFVISSLESVFCNVEAGEELTRLRTGEVACIDENYCPYSEGILALGLGDPLNALPWSNTTNFLITNDEVGSCSVDANEVDGVGGTQASVSPDLIIITSGFGIGSEFIGNLEASEAAACAALMGCANFTGTQE